jgi:hypothetical protein
MISIKESKEFLWLLISADVLFIILGILHVYSGFFLDNDFSLDKDRGFAEVFQYVKEFWIAIMFFWLFINKHQTLYLTWSFLFVYLLIDDSFQLHEKLGIAAADYLGYTSIWKINPKELGELTVFISSGLFFAALIGIVYIYSTDNTRKICRNLLWILAVFAFFGVVVDAIHAMLHDTRLYVIVGILEDGGELLPISVICWYVFRLLRRENSERPLEVV